MSWWSKVKEKVKGWVAPKPSRPEGSLGKPVVTEKEAKQLPKDSDVQVVTKKDVKPVKSGRSRIKKDLAGGTYQGKPETSPTQKDIETSNLSVIRNYRLSKGEAAREKKLSGQTLTPQEEKHYSWYKKERDAAAWKGDKYTFWTAPVWAANKLSGGSMSRKIKERSDYIEINRPRPESISQEMTPKYQEMVSSGKYKVDEEGYLVGEGKVAWEQEFGMRQQAATKEFQAQVKSKYPNFVSSEIGVGKFKINVPQTLSSIWGFTALSPAFSTAAYTEQEQIIRTGKDAGKIKGMSEKEYNELLEGYATKLKGDYFKGYGTKKTYVAPTTTQEKADILYKALTSAKTPLGKQTILKLTYKELGAEEFSKVISQFPKQTTFQVTGAAQAPSTQQVTAQINVEGFSTNQLENIGLTGGVAGLGASQFTPDKISYAQFQNPRFDQITTDLQQPEITTKTKQRSGGALKISPVSAIAPATAVATFTAPALAKTLTPKFDLGGGRGQDFPTKSRFAFKIPKINLGGARFNLYSGRVGAAPSFKYTPSFTALVKGKKGKQPKITRFKGFEMRPITKSWTSTLGIKPKKRKGGFRFKIF